MLLRIQIQTFKIKKSLSNQKFSQHWKSKSIIYISFDNNLKQFIQNQFKLQQNTVQIPSAIVYEELIPMSLLALLYFRNHVSKHTYIDDSENTQKNNFLYKYYYSAKNQSALSLPSIILSCIHLKCQNISFKEFQQLLDISGMFINAQPQLPIDQNVQFILSTAQLDSERIFLFSCFPLQPIELNQQEYSILNQLLDLYDLLQYQDMFSLKIQEKQIMNQTHQKEKINEQQIENEIQKEISINKEEKIQIDSFYENEEKFNTKEKIDILEGEEIKNVQQQLIINHNNISMSMNSVLINDENIITKQQLLIDQEDAIPSNNDGIRKFFTQNQLIKLSFDLRLNIINKALIKIQLKIFLQSSKSPFISYQNIGLLMIKLIDEFRTGNKKKKNKIKQNFYPILNIMTYYDKVNLITNQQQLQEMKEEEQISEYSIHQINYEDKFIQLRSAIQQQQLDEFQQLDMMTCYQTQNTQDQIIKKLKREKIEPIPYKSQDNKRRTISLEFQLQEGRKYNEEFLCHEFIVGKKQKKETQELIDQLLEFQIKIHPQVFNEKIKQLQEHLIEIIESFKNITSIQDQQYDPKLIFFNHLVDFNPDKENLLLIEQLFYQSMEFKKRFSAKLINNIGSQFCTRLKTNQFLPYNLTISVNTARLLDQIAFKQVNTYLPIYWTLQFEWRLGMQQLIFNPLKLGEIATYIVQFEPTYVQLLNLHENDPKRFRSLKNLGVKSIESSLLSMMVSDIGWAYNHDTKDIKIFCDATLLNTKITNQETIIQYLSSFFMPITILSGVPILKIGKSYASVGEQLKTKLIKSVKRSEFEQIMDINDYFEASTIINHPGQRLTAKIRPDIQIIMDFMSRKFTFVQLRNEEMNEIKDIILWNIQFM